MHRKKLKLNGAKRKMTHNVTEYINTEVLNIITIHILQIVVIAYHHLEILRRETIYRKKSYIMER